MNRAFKDFIIFVSGAAVGGVSTWFAVKKYYELKADMEVESVKMAYTDKVAELDEVKDSLNGDIKGPEEIDEKKATVSKSSIVEKLNNKPPLTDYTKYFRQAAETAKITLSEEKARELGIDPSEAEHPEEDIPYTEEEDKEQTLAAIDQQLNGNHKKALEGNLPPHVIDREEFELTCDHYDKISLIYYISDDILCEDNNEEVNRLDLVGVCLETSGFADNEDDELFVRNDKLTTDYEITKVYTRFRE